MKIGKCRYELGWQRRHFRKEIVAVAEEVTKQLSNVLVGVKRLFDDMGCKAVYAVVPEQHIGFWIIRSSGLGKAENHAIIKYADRERAAGLLLIAAVRREDR